MFLEAIDMVLALWTQEAPYNLNGKYWNISTERTLMGEIGRMTRRIGPDLALAQQQAMLDRVDSRPSLAKIACSTLVMCGRQDALTPLAGHEEMAELIPDAKLVVIEDCGHMSPMEKPEAVTAVFQYWLQV